MSDAQTTNSVSHRTGPSIRSVEEDPLQTPVQFVQGVGPKRAELLTKLKIRTVEDLLWYLPRDVLSLTEVNSPDQL